MLFWGKGTQKSAPCEALQGLVRLGEEGVGSRSNPELLDHGLPGNLEERPKVTVNGFCLKGGTGGIQPKTG